MIAINFYCDSYHDDNVFNCIHEKKAGISPPFDLIVFASMQMIIIYSNHCLFRIICNKINAKLFFETNVNHDFDQDFICSLSYYMDK